MIYGTPIFKVEHDQTDQVGLRRLVLSKMWQASRGVISIEELDAEEPGAPEVPGGMGLIGRTRTAGGGVLRTAYVYEGINGNGKDVTFKGRGVSQHYGFEPGFSEVPIQVNPNIGKLLDEFQGQVLDSEIIWPLRLSSQSSGGGLGGAKVSSIKLNPMFGRTSYFSFQGGSYWYRYMARDESEIPNIIGKIFKGGMPGRPPRIGGRDWLGAGAPFTRRGPAAIEVMELYWLSDDKGWPKEIYGNGGTSGDASGSGLTTGGLTTGQL